MKSPTLAGGPNVIGEYQMSRVIDATSLHCTNNTWLCLRVWARCHIGIVVNKQRQRGAQEVSHSSGL